METGVTAAEKFSFAITGTLRFKYIYKKKKKTDPNLWTQNILE